MTRVLDILEDYCNFKRLQYCRIDGSTDGESRDSQMVEFNEKDSEKFVFLLSTRAGGLGINLQTADIVIIYDSDWNPQMDLQAMDRAHRIGQKKQVRVFRLITEGTVEEKIVERAERKLYLDAVVIQQGRLSGQCKTMSKDELAMAVRFGADEIFRSGSEGTITDEDIDAILQRGEERTGELNKKIKSDMQHNLRNFTMDGKKDESDLYAFDGENYKKGKDGKKGGGGLGGGAPTMIDIGNRERKTVTYNANEYYRGQIDEGDVKGNGERVTRKHKPPQMHDFQFFQQARIGALYEKEYEMELQRKTQIQMIREMRVKETSERREVSRARMMEEAALRSAGLDDDDDVGGGRERTVVRRRRRR